MDLSQSYQNMINKILPDAEIVADRFHVMKQINNELDSQRKKEKKKAEAETKKAKSRKKT